MNGRRASTTLATALAAALCLATVAAAAPGDTVLTGSTTEGVSVKLTVAEAGNATALRIGKTTVECKRGGTLRNKPGTYRGFDTSEVGRFSDRSQGSSNHGAYHFEAKWKIAGEASADASSWSGTLRSTTKVFKQGRKIDTCKLKTAWDAA